MFPIKLDPTVNNDELTPSDTFAEPDTSRLAAGVVVPIPILLLIESTNKVPESTITLPDIVCNVPLRVALLTVVLPDIVTSPLKSPVFADITNLPTVFPRSIVLEVAAKAVVFITNPEVLKLAAFTAPV